MNNYIVKLKNDYIFEISQIPQLSNQHIFPLDDWCPNTHDNRINYDFVELSKHTNLTLEFIINNPDKPWLFGKKSQQLDIINDWDFLSNSVTWEFVKDNLNKPWCWIELSMNPNVTWDLINQNSDKPWCWYYLSFANIITWDIINNNPDKPWVWAAISMNKNITWDIIKNNPDKPWDFDYISMNPNIDFSIIKENLDKQWNWFVLSKNINIFKFPQPNLILGIRKYTAAKVIWKFWFRSANDPSYAICKKRLSKLFINF
jgi:hypothetical protein